MSNENENGGFPLEELKEFKDELKKDIDDKLDSFKEVLNTGIKSIFDLLTQYSKTNDRDHQDLKEELIHLRGNDRDLYEKLNTAAEKTDGKITSVRLDLEKKIDSNSEKIVNLEIEPGKKAADNLRSIGMNVIKVVIGMAIMALIWAISQGAPIIP